MCSSDLFRCHAIAGQAQNRLEAARKVLAALEDDDQDRVLVPGRDIDSWVSVLAALRAQWHVELTPGGHRSPPRQEPRLEILGLFRSGEKCSIPLVRNLFGRPLNKFRGAEPHIQNRKRKIQTQKRDIAVYQRAF